MIEIKNLTKRFPPDVIAVNNLTLNIDKGVNGLIGENGAGKSTLLRPISDVYVKDEGEITIGGNKVAYCGSGAIPLTRELSTAIFINMVETKLSRFGILIILRVITSSAVRICCMGSMKYTRRTSESAITASSVKMPMVE